MSTLLGSLLFNKPKALPKGHKCAFAMQADKRYQLADWRIRPLPQEMLLYARMDTHYLLYMYDHLKVSCTRA